MKNYYAHGDHLAICDVCGFKFKGSQLRLRWDNAMVCAKDWEPRQPQDLLRPGRVSRPLKNPRPEPDDVFI